MRFPIAKGNADGCAMGDEGCDVDPACGTHFCGGVADEKYFVFDNA